MQNLLDPATLDIICRLGVALLLGMLLGVERVWARKNAGIRTYALVSMGAAMFVLISEMMAQKYGLGSSFDPSRIASQVVVGIGFLGAGAIIFQGNRLIGLTTAGGLWVAAGIGIASGFGLYKLALISTLFTLFVFIALWFFEAGLKKTEFYKDQNPGDDN
jgi:putative Mg2+ transporter-C (MgtC) family protein